MPAIVAPRQIKARSRTGREKAGHVFKLLRIKGFEPFDPVHLPYAQERVRHADGTWTDVQLRTDLGGTPITREQVDGELCDVTWWHGKPTTEPCMGCSLANGRATRIVRTVRAARVRSDNRVPRVQDAGHWHPGCLAVKLRHWGRLGYDFKQTAMASK